MKTAYLLTLTLLPAIVSYAQDANYWSSNYGPGGFLTAGAVIANNRDSGVFFYNPALLGFSTKSSASISANIYSLESINIKNGVGTGKNLKSSQGSIIPLMASGSISVKGITIGYALISNPVINFQATQREDSKRNVLDDSYSPGPEYFIGQYSIQNTLTSTAAILSIGKKLSNNLSVGISMEGSLVKQTYNATLSSRALVNSLTDTIFPPQASTSAVYNAKYQQVGMRFKAGIAYDVDVHHFGLMVTTPLIRMYSGANLLTENVINNIRIGGSDLALNLLANTRQTNLKARYKMPVSIAGGYAYDYGKGQLYVAAEYFAKIKEYNIITPRNDFFIRPDSSNNSATSDLIKLKDAHKALTNFSIGFSYQVKENMMAYLSLRTDFTYADSSLYKNDDGYTAGTSVWNNYHMQLGANFKKRKFNLRTGLLIGYGRTNKFMQDINYDNPNEANLLLGEGHNTTATHLSLGIMFSYIHNL